jgi:hypothetical protein
MSLWTPGGEHTPPPQPSSEPAPPGLDDMSPEERRQLEAMQAEMAEVRAQLLAAPAAVVVANHAMGIYELAAIHLTAPEPKLSEAVLAIDALAALVEGLAEHALALRAAGELPPSARRRKGAKKARR